MLTAFWRRLDTPGHDACRLQRNDPGWQLDGTAVFRHEAGVAAVHYHVACDDAWRCRYGQASGWIGRRDFHFSILRTADGLWMLNDAVSAGLEGCVDLDFGFTPATNFIQLRRLGLTEGQRAEVPVAWLDIPEGELQLLPQRYERRDALSYWYEAPTAGYAGVLEVDAEGFARRYPGLWEMEK